MTLIIRKLGRPNCQPCNAMSNYLKLLKPQITELGAAYSEHDVMVERALLEKYEIQSVPVLIFERNGVEVARLNGLAAPEEIIDVLKHAKEVR